ncbi:MAG TPA: TIR domain-containing protein [Smithellaceae bacterium]|nr:TIR domain-containing protein [Smithellaceae bacterium]
MAYKNKTFVSFDGDTDMQYYRLMLAWKQNDNMPFNFYNAHDLNTARDSSMEASIKAQLAERMRNSKVFVILVGESTRYLYKFVRWEIEQAISRNMPIIVVNLNGTRFMDSDRCPPILRGALAVHVSFNAKIMQHALENWPTSHDALQRERKTGPYYYKEEVYQGYKL